MKREYDDEYYTIIPLKKELDKGLDKLAQCTYYKCCCMNCAYNAGYCVISDDMGQAACNACDFIGYTNTCKDFRPRYERT